MRNKKIPAIVRSIFLIAVSLTLGIQIYSWNARSLAGNALPMPFGYGAAVVLSGSMEPTIMTDDLILVREAQDYAIGDIVVFQSGGMVVVHRIVAMDEEMVTTRGDANNAEDTPIARRYIKGKVVGQISGLGRFVRLLKSPAVTLTLIAAAVLAVEMPYRREKEKKEEDLERLKEEIRKLKDEL